MKLPPQHGAWAFLIVPAAMASFLGAGNWFGFLFFLTWVSSYPVSYFLGRAIVSRIRRGAWTGKALSDLHSGVPWIALSSAGAIALVSLRPWILVYAILLLLLLSVSVYLSWAGRERGIVNDVLLIFLASIEPVLMYQVAKDHPSLHGIPHSMWIASVMSLLFFIGSVLHVKALIRERKNRQWHMFSIFFHAVTLAVLLIFATHGLLAVPFVLAFARTIFMQPGLRPGTIGIVEAGVAITLIACTVLATV